MKKINGFELKNYYYYSNHGDYVIVWDNGTYVADRVIHFDNGRGFVFLAGHRFYMEGVSFRLVRE